MGAVAGCSGCSGCSGLVGKSHVLDKGGEDSGEEVPICT
jgi:hypothetical protein